MALFIVDRLINRIVLLTAFFCVIALALLVAASPRRSLAPSPPRTVAESPSSPSTLHQWGAVPLFHGLPSYHVRAIAEDPDGAMWCGAVSCLAKYGGRRVQKVA